MGTLGMGAQKTMAREAAVSDTKLQNALENLAATELVGQNVSFDFKKFLNEVGPAPSFGQPLGPTPECLSVDVIRSFHLEQLENTLRSSVEQHVTVCSTCSELLASYVEPQPGVMPEHLFQRISTHLGRSSASDNLVKENAEAKHEFVWPRLSHLLRWVAAPAAVALVLLWVFSPATPYLQQGTSRFRDAWVAFRGRETAVPNDPRELQGMLNRLVQASNRGQLPPLHQVDRMLETVSLKSTLAQPNDPYTHLWTTGRTQLAAFDALSHYEALRKRTGNDAVSLKDLKISQLRDVNGIPGIAVESDDVRNRSVQVLLEKSVAQSGIPRLYVFQGSTLVYDIAPKPEDATFSPK